MDTIQADALRRVKEMQSNSINRRNDRPPFENVNQSYGGGHNTPEKHQSDHPLPEKGKEEKEIKENSSLFADKEKVLILALILLLSGEDNSDPSLTLALLYLII